MDQGEIARHLEVLRRTIDDLQVGLDGAAPGTKTSLLALRQALTELAASASTTRSEKHGGPDSGEASGTAERSRAEIPASAYRAMMEQAADAIFIADSWGTRLLDVNPSACELMGYSREQLLRLRVQDLFLAEDLALDPLRFDLLGRGETLRRERRMRRRDGTLVSAELSIRMLTDGSVQTFARDITERKRIEQALRESEAKYRILAEEALAGVYIIQDGKFAYANRRLAEMAGYDIQELLGKDFLEFLVPESREQAAENLRRRLAGELVETRVVKGRHKNGSILDIEVRGALTTYDGRPAIVGTLLDRTAEQQATETLRRSEANRRILLEQASDAIFIADSQGSRLLDVNSSACEMLGYGREELLRLKAQDVYPAEDLAGEHLRIDLLLQGETVRRERRLRRKDGTLVPVESSTKMVAGGQILSITRDISERKRAEQALRESEAKYRILAEETLVGVYVIQDDKFVYVNQRLAEMGGYTVNELLGRDTLDVIAPEDRSKVVENIRRRMAGEAASLRYNVKVLCRDGSKRDGEVYGTVASYNGRQAILGTVIDRTEELRATESLRRSEENYRIFMEQAPDAMVIVDGEFRVLDVNTRMCDLVQYPRQALVGMRFQELYVPEDLVAEPPHHELLEGQTVLTQRRLRLRDGTLVTVEVHGRLLADGRISGILRDISERRRTEQALQESEAKYRVLVEQNMVGVYILQDGKWAYINQCGAEIFGYTVEELLALDPMVLSVPEQRALVQEHVRRRLAGEVESLRYDVKAVHKSGALRDIEVHGTAVQYDGRPAIMGTLIDRTEERHAAEALRRSEAELRASERHYRLLFDSNPQPMFVADAETLDFVAVNDAAVQHYGYSRDEFLSLNARDIRPPEDVPKLIESVSKLSQGRTTVGLHRHRKKDGSIIDVEVVVHLLDFAGRNAHLILAQDVTARKQAEEKLRAAEVKYRTLVEQLPAIVYLLPLDGPARPQYVSPQIEAVLGYAPDGHTGQPGFWMEKLHPQDRERVRAEVARCLAIGAPFACEYRLLDRDDRVHWFQDQSVILRDEGGRPQFVQGVLLDITEREVERTGHARSRALSRRLVEVQEAERRRVGLELHDEIGQTLTGVKLAIEMGAKLPAAAAGAVLQEASRLVAALMVRVRDLSIDLRPAILDDLGLLQALLWHIDRYSQQTGVRVEFDHRGLRDQRFASELETAAYRVVQEALTNVARHAGAGRVRVHAWAEAGMLGVQIEDAGRGFDAEAVMASPEAVGLAGMMERVSLVGGDLCVESAPGRGCRVTAELPLESTGEEESDDHQDPARG